MHINELYQIIIKSPLYVYCTQRNRIHVIFMPLQVFYGAILPTSHLSRAVDSCIFALGICYLCVLGKV